MKETNSESLPPLKRMTPEQLERLIELHDRRVKWIVATIGVLFVAGVWIDWRFFPTMLIPSGALVLQTEVGKLARAELERRTDA